MSRPCKVVPYGGPKNKNQFRIRPRFRRNQALWAKNTDADGFGICSPLVFDRSAEQIGRKPICPNLIGTGSSLIYQISYLFLNRNQSRIGPRRRQNHKAWPEIWTRTGTDPGLVPVFVKTIRNGLSAPLSSWSWRTPPPPCGWEGGCSARKFDPWRAFVAQLVAPVRATTNSRTATSK